MFVLFGLLGDTIAFAFFATGGGGVIGDGWSKTDQKKKTVDLSRQHDKIT